MLYRPNYRIDLVNAAPINSKRCLIDHVCDAPSLMPPLLLKTAFYTILLVTTVSKGVSKKWTMPIRDWEQALNQLAIQFGDRFPGL